MGKWCLSASLFIFDWIFIKVAGDQNRHKSLVEFDFGPNQTTHFGVICPWVTKISHFWTWISLKPIGQSWSNFMCSIIGVGERLHKVLGQIDLGTLDYGERLLPFGLLVFDLILFILAGNKDMHKISDEFEFRPDRTTDYGVSCPWESKKFPIDLWKTAVSMLARSFFIESSSKLLVTRTGIKARLSLILGRIWLLSLELLALEWSKFYTFKLKFFWGQLANLDQILCVASQGVGKGCIMFWGRLDQNSGVHGNKKPPLTYNGENGVSTFSQLLLIWSFLYLQVTGTCIKSWTKSNFSRIGPLTKELAALSI